MGRPGVAMLLMTAIGIGAGCTTETFVPPVAGSGDDCAHGPAEMGSPVGVFALSGAITNIPEYHDCQRFIDQTGAAYLPAPGRMAIYVREGLAAVPLPTAVISPERQAAPDIEAVAAGDTGGIVPPLRDSLVASAEPIAIVWNIDSTSYPPLGITPDFGFYCVVLMAGPSAKLVGVANEAACVPGNPVVAARPGVPLQVNAHASSDVPATGRWAWDYENKRHYIVMACPGGWCEIYYKTLVPERPGTSVEAAKAASPGGHDFGPWIDVQPLALSGTVGMTPDVVGTGIPARDVGDKGVPDFDLNQGGGWTTVGYLHLTGDNDTYRAKLNLAGESAGTLQLCAWKGDGKSCLPSPLLDHASNTPVQASGCEVDPVSGLFWAARIVRKEGWKTDIRYHCVKRTDHSDQGGVPATLRWRWVASDETKWSPCAKGCCRVM